jgi:hypothetical protein
LEEFQNIYGHTADLYVDAVALWPKELELEKRAAQDIPTFCRKVDYALECGFKKSELWEVQLFPEPRIDERGVCNE